MMNLPPSMIQRLFLPLASLHSRTAFYRRYRALLKSQFFPRSTLEKMQRGRLQAILRHAFDTVPFYREWLGDHHLAPERFGSAEQLEQLPLLNKQIIRSFPLEKFLSQAVPPRERLPYSTSGSTGEPFQFVVDRAFNGAKIARYFREMSHWGIQPGNPYLKLWGAGRVPTAGSESTRSFFIQKILGRREVLAFDLSPEKAWECLSWMKKEHLAALEAYTSSAVYLAHLVLEEGWSFPHLRAVVVSGETLTEEHRQILKKAFQVPVINAYGSREFGRVAFSCAEDRMCYSMEDFYAEYLDTHPPDSKGLKRLVLTCFSNHAMPFIRYDTGDLVEPCMDAAAPGGLGLHCWKRVAGRLADQVITPHGKHLSVHYFTLLFEDYGQEIRQFQIVVTGKDRLHLLIVPGSSFTHSLGEEMCRRILKSLEGSMQVDYTLVDSIPHTGDGKQPLLRVSSGGDLP
ncbi:MAG: Phenylacetate-coenzyme A ligase [Candidatus Hinthialibacteria bacterium OLB16]|nr:MAG: Phenylacetate-coenzyme A ligase [Candidatus Hinthialibacteria bacterium OLB16]